MAFRAAGDIYGPSDKDFSALNDNKYIPQLYSKKILKKFYEKIIFRNIANMDYEGEIKGMGDKVYIRQAPEVTINAHEVGQDIVYESLDSVSTQLNIDKAFNWGFQMYDEDEVQIDIAATNLATENASIQLDLKTEKEVFQYMATAASPLNSGEFAGLISGVGGSRGTPAGEPDTANTSGGIDLGKATAPISLTGDNTVDYIVYLNQILDEQNIPSENRWVVLPAWACAKLKLGDLKRADVTGDSAGLIRTGLIGKIDRTMVYQSNNLYTVTDTTQCTYILAGITAATTFAAQITKSEQLRIEKKFGNFYRGLFVYGRKVVQPEALAVLYATPGA